MLALLRRTLLVAGTFQLLIFIAYGHAAAAEVGDTATLAVIRGRDDIGIRQPIILDGTASRASGDRIDYRWTIDETKQVIARTTQAIFTPERPGVLTFRLQVTSTDSRGKVERSEAVHPIVVYKRKVLLLADKTMSEEKQGAHQIAAREAGVYLRILTPEVTDDIDMSAALLRALTEQKDALLGAEAIILWSDPITSMQALIERSRIDTDTAAELKKTSIIAITDRSLSQIERSTKGARDVLKPTHLILTRKEALSVLTTSASVSDALRDLSVRDIEARDVVGTDAYLRPWNVLSTLVNYLLSHGVSSSTVTLLLMLPVIATIFAFLKQVIGVTSFGLYTPSIIALSFLSLGWKIGLFCLIFILCTGYGTRTVMKRWRLMYIPKFAIILTVLSVTLLLLVAFGTAFGITITRDSVFMLLILSTLSENFLNLKAEEGFRSAVRGVAETVLGALIVTSIVQWPLVTSLVIAYPELILGTIIINVFLGRFTGLRLIEYFRFRAMFSPLQEE